MQFSSLSSDMPQELAATQAPVPSEMRQASVFLVSVPPTCMRPLHAPVQSLISQMAHCYKTQ